MFCQASFRESAQASCSRAAPTLSSARVSARVQRLNFCGKPTAHSRNITYSVPHMESMTSAYAIMLSSIFRAACTASMFPPPPIQLPQRAPSGFQASTPRIPRMTAKEITNPSPTETAAAKKPISILGPNRSILRRSQRSSIMNSMA
ncbi:unknown [Eubacterium sp. CAG:786]|nr:unknown [Eubacterium sp. CAG:786]